MKENKKLHITIEITDDSSYTVLNHDNFEKAILALIAEKEWYNFDTKKEWENKIKKAFKK